MDQLPRTQIEGVSFPRLIIGTNWFLGCSHQTRARDRHILETVDEARMADIIEVFMASGADAVYGVHPHATNLENAIRTAEDRTGRKCIRIAIPIINVQDGPEALAETEKMLDDYAACGTELLMPHQASTDALVDRRTRSIKNMATYSKMIRERGMLPGLSTHMPETIPYADETELDVATYIQIYNGAGFLMQVEVDWVQRIIWEARKPVMTIKPLAAGRMHPLVGLAFSWSTLRPQDMITVGTLTPDEAREVVEYSFSILENRKPDMDLQRTRSKHSLDGKEATVAAAEE